MGVPPFEQSPGQIDRIVRNDESGCAEPRLIAESRRGPLRRAPGRYDDDAEHDRDLTDVDSCWIHSPPHSPATRRRDEDGEFAKPSIEIKDRAGSVREIDHG